MDLCENQIEKCRGQVRHSASRSRVKRMSFKNLSIGLSYLKMLSLKFDVKQGHLILKKSKSASFSVEPKRNYLEFSAVLVTALAQTEQRCK